MNRSKAWVVAIAVFGASLACVSWVLPLGYAFQIVLLGLIAGFCSSMGTVSWMIWGPVLLVPSIVLQAIVLSRTQGWRTAFTVQGTQWVVLVLAVAAGAIVGGTARRRRSIAPREPATEGTPGSGKRLVVLAPVIAIALAVVSSVIGFADPLIIEFGFILVGVPALVLAIVCFAFRKRVAATVFLAIPVYFVALLPLQPLAELARETRSLGAMRSYCETLVPMLHKVKETTGRYPRTLLEPPFSEVETPFTYNHQFGGVEYTTDEQQFNLIVYSHTPRDRSQTYNSETGRWVDGTHYPSNHSLHELPERTRQLTIDGAGNKTWGWR